jgi:hypothetical protein
MAFGRGACLPHGRLAALSLDARFRRHSLTRQSFCLEWATFRFAFEWITSKALLHVFILKAK